MAEENVKWYNHGWTYVVGGALLAPVGTLVFDKITNVKIFTTISQVINWLGNVIVLVFNYKFKVWEILLAIAILSILRFFYKTFAKTAQSSDINEDDILTAVQMELEPKLLAYKADKFKGEIWQWDWVKNPVINRYEVKNPSLICKGEDCGNRRMHSSGQFSHHCNGCGKAFISELAIEEVVKHVERRFEPLT